MQLQICVKGTCLQRLQHAVRPYRMASFCSSTSVYPWHGSYKPHLVQAIDSLLTLGMGFHSYLTYI